MLFKALKYSPQMGDLMTNSISIGKKIGYGIIIITILTQVLGGNWGKKT